METSRLDIVFRDCETIFSEINVNTCNLVDSKFVDYRNGLNHVWETKSPKDLSLHFMRGLFDSERGVFETDTSVSIAFDSLELATIFMKSIKLNLTLTRHEGKHIVRFTNNNMIDFLGKIYPPTSIFCNNHKYTLFKQLRGFGGNSCGVFKVQRVKPNAIIPSKPNFSDSGFDLTIIEKIKTKGDVDFYTTGLAIQPSLGYYCHIYPRSSISKTGYMLANSVGVIDSSFVGELIVALRKVDKDADDIELPCRIAQLVPMRCCYPDMIEVDSIEETNRGSGGFGSSGN